MRHVTAIEQIRLKYHSLEAVLDERSRRQWAATETRDYGYGGVVAGTGDAGRPDVASALNVQEHAAAGDGFGRPRATRLWKVALQGLADATGLKLTVSHFPPGTSKWNKVERRLFRFITQNWPGQPLGSIQVIVNLIAVTRTMKKPDREDRHRRSQVRDGHHGHG